MQQILWHKFNSSKTTRRITMIAKKASLCAGSKEQITVPNGFSDVPGDGLCFYHAIVFQLNSSYTAQDIKAKAIDHILTNQAYYKTFVNGLEIPEIKLQMTFDRAMEKYINYHLKANTWADHLIIQAVADALGMSIVVCMFDIDGIESGRMHVNPHQDFMQHQGGSIRKLVIGNISNLHFVTQELITAET